MSRESLLLVVSVLCASVIMGWIIWSERPVPALATPAIGAPLAGNGTDGITAAPVIDEDLLAELRMVAEQDPSDVVSRVALGNLYFDARLFDEAIPWYEEALALNLSDVDVSTDLGVSYYYVEQPERAVVQFERSLEVDPMHAKTLLNLGIVRAFGLQDLDGALAAWERVIEVAPESAEARAARDALERIDAAHVTGELGGTATERD